MSMMEKRWGFQCWIETCTRCICARITENTLREQSAGRLMFHGAVRHVRASLLARGFQRWALVLDFKLKAMAQKCESQVQIYARWGKMKYDSVMQERRLWNDKDEQQTEIIRQLEAKLSDLNMQLEQFEKEKNALVQGNLIKIQKLAEIRLNPAAVNDVFDDPALTVLNPEDASAASNVQQTSAIFSSSNGISMETYEETKRELDDLRAKLVERTETMSAEVAELKPEAECAPTLREEVQELTTLFQTVQFSAAQVTQSLAVKALQGHLMTYYKTEVSRVWMRWVHIVKDSKARLMSDLAKRADRRLQKLEDINRSIEHRLVGMHRMQTIKRGHHMMSRWWATNAEWAFGRWQKSVCFRRLTLSLQNKMSPVVGQTILDSKMLADSSAKLSHIAFTDSTFPVSPLTKLRHGPQVIPDIKQFLDLSETLLRHAVRLQDHGRSMEAVFIIECIERSIKHHTASSGSELLDDVSEALQGTSVCQIRTAAAAVRSVTQELNCDGKWREIVKADMFRSYVSEQDVASVVSVKAEGILNASLPALIFTLLDTEHFVDWVPLLLHASLTSESSVFQRSIQAAFIGPGPYANRCAKAGVLVVDVLDDDVVVVSVASEVSEDATTDTCAVDVKQMSFVLKPTTEAQTVVTLFFAIDFKLPLDHVPPQVGTLVASKLAPSCFTALEKAADGMHARKSLRSCEGSHWALHTLFQDRLTAYLQYRSSQGHRRCALGHMDEIEAFRGIQAFTDEIQEITDILGQDLEILCKEFQLSSTTSLILHDAQDAGATVADLFGNNEESMDNSGRTSTKTSPNARTSVLATLSKARQRSKLLTAVASRRRTKQKEPVKEIEDLPAGGDVDLNSNERHYLLFTSSFADSLDVKAKTDRMVMIFEARGLTYDSVDLYTDPAIRDDMEELSGDRETLPQLFVDGEYLEGGLEELQYLHDSDLL